MVESRREIAARTERELRFYITSLGPDAKRVGEAMRGHWSIENGPHWVMDMVFRDNECRIGKDNAPANVSTVKHMASNPSRRAPGKDSQRVKRKMAAWDDDFLASLVAPNQRSPASPEVGYRRKDIHRLRSYSENDSRCSAHRRMIGSHLAPRSAVPPMLPLQSRSILFVSGETDALEVELRDALDRAGAETAIARAPEDALAQLDRFEFDGVIINPLPGEERAVAELIGALGGVPTLLLCAGSTALSQFAPLPVLVKPVAAGAVIGAMAPMLGVPTDG
jgi:predicted transposase YbfD/YdcC